MDNILTQFFAILSFNVPRTFLKIKYERIDAKEKLVGKA